MIHTSNKIEDGRKIFIDCGANRGQSIIQARRQYGPDVEIYSFEAVPILYSKLTEKWSSTPNVYLYNNAVWIKNEEVKIFLATTYSDASTLYQDKIDRPIDSSIFNIVQGVDIAEFIRTHFSKEDYIVFKFDIEGAEYDVLYHLAQENILSYFNELVGEWHIDKFSPKYVEEHLKYKNEFIQREIEKSGLVFKHWDTEVLSSEQHLLTLDARNLMP